MKKKIIAVDLEFPKEIEFYGPRANDKHLTYPKRHKLRGKLRIITSQPTSIYSIEIRFKGITQLYWRDPLSHSLLATRMVNMKTIRKSKHILLQEGTLPSGVTDLGFEMTIPGYVYPTYQSDYVNIKYGITARITPTSKFAKDIEVYRDIIIKKTLMPKDVATGIMDGYQVPRCTMRGQRKNWLAWEFKVPKWVCLANNMDVEFSGYLKSLNDQLIVDMIQVDVVQEDLYFDDASDQSRRHLITCPNIPSTYLHPPLESNILFQFPLSTLQKKILKSTIQDKNNTYIKCDDLNYSLQSPFLITRHYIRIIIYTRNKNEQQHQQQLKDKHFIKPSPICIGLPIQLTEYIQPSTEPSDLLPSYQSLVRDGERLPDYVTTEECPTPNENEEENEEDEEQVEQEQESPNVTIELLENIIGASHHQRSFMLNHRQSAGQHNKREGNIVVQERRLDDFWLELS